MKHILLGTVILLPTLAGCSGFVRQLPTPVQATPLPTFAPPTPEPTIAMATPTLVLPPAPSATPTLTKPSGGASSSGASIPARRIQFQTGATSSTIQGTLGVNKIDYYVLRALEGQKLTVVATPTSSQVHLLLQVSGADGNPLKTMGAGGSNWTGTLRSTQDYFIAIAAEGGMATDYTLEITIPPLTK